MDLTMCRTLGRSMTYELPLEPPNSNECKINFPHMNSVGRTWVGLNETEEAHLFTLKVEGPGLKMEQVKLGIENGVLTVTVSVPKEESADNKADVKPFPFLAADDFKAQT